MVTIAGMVTDSVLCRILDHYHSHIQHNRLRGSQAFTCEDLK